MNLGAFSLSLNVKDIQDSLEFYQKLGFTVFHGEVENKWMILKNGNCTLGLFEGMIPKNILTFNPGWDENAQPVGEFVDVREWQERLKGAGVELMLEVEEGTSGPGHLVLEDPDGNQIMLDQHV